MRENQIQTFVRNRYYTGKMLTSKDFQTEQTYMNQKRSFLNQMMYGTGVVCGLSVKKLDEISFMVESGVAIDEQGREIIVPVSIVKKISALAGAEQLTGNKAALCLRYKEEAIHPVYSVANEEEDKEYEYNHMQEGYELYLENVSEETGDEEEFLNKSVFLKQEDFKITLMLPKTVKKGKKVKLVTRIEKLTDRKCGLNFQAVLQLAAFRQEDGSQELKLEGKDIYLDKDAVKEQVFWLSAEQSEVEQTSILLAHGTGYASVAECDCKINENLELQTAMTDMDIEKMAASELGRENYESRAKKAEQKKIVLAEFYVIGADGVFVITGVKEREAKNYINTPESLGKRLILDSYFAEPDESEKKRSEVSETAEQKAEKETSGPIMSNGFVEIPLNVGMKKGDVCYSDEILHGLGKGDVYVKVGIQCMEEDVRTNQNTKTTIYGNSDLFEEDNHMKVETAVKVYNDKGSFQIAARLNGAQKSIVLLVHWVAVKFQDDGVEMEEEFADKRIVPKTSTVKLAPKASYCFQVEFEHMNQSRLTYELTEADSGEITQDGIYTAPDKAGVYEIHIYCTDMPEISTYVYAVVKKAEESVSLEKSEN